MTREQSTSPNESKLARHRRIRGEATQEIQANQSANRPRRALKEARSSQRESNYELKQAKQTYRRSKKTNDSDQMTTDKEKLQKAKDKHQVTKKVHQAAIKRNGGTRKQKVARRGYQVGRQIAEGAVANNDTLGDIADTRQKIRGNQAKINQTKKIAKYSYRLGKQTTSGVYGLTNRGYNLVRGRGFTRTVKADR